MGTETGKRKLILTLRFVDHRDQVPFAVGADMFQTLHHLRLLLRPRVGNSSQLLIYPIPVLRSQSPRVTVKSTLPILRGYVPASVRTNPTGKVLNSGLTWSVQGHRIFEIANNKDVYCIHLEGVFLGAMDAWWRMELEPRFDYFTRNQIILRNYY